MPIRIGQAILAQNRKLPAYEGVFDGKYEEGKKKQKLIGRVKSVGGYNFRKQMK